MSGCCNELGCRRSKPIKVMQSGLTGVWYAVTDYVDLGDDRFEAKAKHKLPPDNQRELSELQAALVAQQRTKR